MSEVVIQKHDFEVAKREIRDFAKKVPNSVSIEKVETDGGLFNWGNHKVTGEEFNSRMRSIQALMIGQNKSIKEIITKFSEIYKALDALDKDYITAIISSIEAAAKASNEAKDAQVSINRTIEALKLTVEKLKEFKHDVTRELRQLKADSGMVKGRPMVHLKDIDDIWDTVNRTEVSLGGLSEKLMSIQAEGNKLGERISQQEQLGTQLKDGFDVFSVDANRAIESVKGSLHQLNDFRVSLESFRHLAEIDDTWELVHGIAGELDTLCEDVKKNGESINAADVAHKELVDCVTNYVNAINTAQQQLFEYKTVLEGYEHLHEIDDTWELVQSTSKKAEALSEGVKSHDALIASAREAYDGLVKTVSDHVDTIKANLQQLFDYQRVLEGYEHLHEVDETWELVQRTSKKTEALSDGVKSHDVLIASAKEAHDGLVKTVSDYVDAIKANLQKLFDYQRVLEGYEHLHEIDELWSNTQHLEEVTNNLGDRIGALGQTLLNISNRIDFAEETNRSSQLNLSKRIRRDHILFSCAFVALIVFGLLGYFHII